MTIESNGPLTDEAAAQSLLATPDTGEGTKLTKGAKEAPEPEELDTEKEDTADAVEADEEEDQEGDEDADVDGEDEVDTEDDDGEDDADQDEPDSEMFTVKVDGKEERVSIDDLKRSYSGQAHIQRQMQQAAETRKQVEGALGALTQQRAMLAQLGNEIQQLGVAPPSPPDPATFDTDPIGYMNDRLKYDEEKVAYDARVSNYRQQLQQQDQLMKAAQAKYLAEQRQALEAFIPDFADPAKVETIQRKIVRTAKEAYGFSDEEIGAVVDARMVRVLDDARRWNELQASKRDVVKKATRDAKPPLKAAKKARIDPQAAARKRNREELKRTGSVDAAVNLLLGR